MHLEAETLLDMHLEANLQQLSICNSVLTGKLVALIVMQGHAGS